MSDLNDDIIDVPQEDAEDDGPDSFFINILTGNKESPSPKKLLFQKVLRQLIESYGFDRKDIEVDYKHRIKASSKNSPKIFVVISDVLDFTFTR